MEASFSLSYTSKVLRNYGYLQKYGYIPLVIFRKLWIVKILPRPVVLSV